MRSLAILLLAATALVAPVRAQQNPPISDIGDDDLPATNQPLRITPQTRKPPRPDRIVGDTLTANPEAYRRWLRRKIIEDLVDLYDVTNSLVVELAPSRQIEAKLARKQAERIVKLSHNIWSNIQMRRPTRERPQPDKSATPRTIAAAQADAITARNLVRAVARLLNEEQNSGGIDAANHVNLLEKLEQVELIGHQLRKDAIAADSRK